jgi:hypothetical protein
MCRYIFSETSTIVQTTTFFKSAFSPFATREPVNLHIIGAEISEGDWRTEFGSGRVAPFLADAE